jgi:hypothetical protein
MHIHKPLSPNQSSKEPENQARNPKMKPQIRKSKHARTISHQQVESVVAAAVVVIVVVVVNKGKEMGEERKDR